MQRAASAPNDGLKEAGPPVELIGFIVFGLVVGVIARLIVPGKQRLGVGVTLLVGVAGSIVGGVIAHEIGTGDLWELNFLGSVIAIVTAAGRPPIAPPTTPAGCAGPPRPRSPWCCAARARGPTRPSA